MKRKEKVSYENSFAYRYPELAQEWHPTKNKTLKAREVYSMSKLKVWWYLPYDDPETGKHFEFEWEETVENRVRGYKCPYLTGKKAWPGFNDLASLYPQLASQFHPTKNVGLDPSSIPAHSAKYVWWYLPYDDPETGKHYDFEWLSKVNNRTNGDGCPFLSGKKVWQGYNDLKTRSPKLAKEWHPYRNGELLPEQVSWCSGKKVWWYLPYDDPETGKHFDFEWEATIASRVAGNGCPFLRGYSWPGFNDLFTKAPDIAAEWHPTKNGKLKPTDVTSYSSKSVWWYLPYDDPETGKHFDFEWKEKVSNRMHSCGCPFLTGHRVWPGFNDLSTKAPDIAAEWHPTKNGKLKPTDVTPYSNKSVWWYLPYDDPETGKHFDFEWKNTVNGRTSGNGCPFISGQSVWPGYNDLETWNPKLVKEWDFEKNGELKPSNIAWGSHKKVWWKLPYTDELTGAYYEFEWKASVKSRQQGCGCPFLSGKKVWSGFNDLESMAPELSKEWHPTKNHRIKPNMVCAHSNIKRWWICENGHEWRTSPANRMQGKNCKYCCR